MGEEAKVDALVTCALKGQRTLLDSSICSLCKMIMVILVEYPDLNNSTVHTVVQLYCLFSAAWTLNCVVFTDSPYARGPNTSPIDITD